MVSVGRRHFQVGGCGMARIADRNMQFVSCDDAELRIAKFPPVLMADHDDIQRSMRLAGVLCIEDNPGGGQEENHNDEYWNDRPGKLDLITAVNLRGFILRIGGALAIAYEDVS